MIQVYDVNKNKLEKEIILDQIPGKILSNNKHIIVQLENEIRVSGDNIENVNCRIPLDPSLKINELRLQGNKIIGLCSPKSDPEATQILLWNAKTGEIMRKIDNVGQVNDIAIDVNILAVAAKDINVVYFFDLKHPKENYALVLGKKNEDSKLFKEKIDTLNITKTKILHISNPQHCAFLNFKKNHYILLGLEDGSVEMIKKKE